MHETTGPVPFAIGYNRSQGEGLVYGCVLLGLMMAVVGVVAGLPLLSLAALLPLGIAFWHYPMVEKGQPQLGANEDGLFVDRIGFINWAAVSEIDIKRTSVRNIILVRLEILLNCPLGEAINKDQALPPWKNLMLRNWRRVRSETNCDAVIVNLHTLAADPDEIFQRLRRYKSA
ncbi:hypothetical protein [uncultured Roseibium sp.]|uniref:hypothetical protein n=1 Tax=uncultured Roseibium sp. TaxID=1936171 RepID=UPI0026352EB9|nr:hypothetical protein [uncultured Roseibium sp.]